MSASIVHFPDGGKYPAARLTKLDQRVLALIARHLAAYRALQCAFDEAPDSDSDNIPEAELAPLRAAVTKPEDDLADIAERDLFVNGWLNGLGTLVDDSRFRREQAS